MRKMPWELRGRSDNFWKGSIMEEGDFHMVLEAHKDGRIWIREIIGIEG